MVIKSPSMCIPSLPLPPIAAPDLPATLVYQHANLAAIAAHLEQRLQEKEHQRAPPAAVISVAPSGNSVIRITIYENGVPHGNSSNDSGGSGGSSGGGGSGSGSGGNNSSSSQGTSCRRLPYPVYLLLQYLLCCLGYIVPCIRFAGAVIAFTYVLYSKPGVSRLAWLWYGLAMPWLTLTLSAATVLLLVGCKWAVIGRLRPGRYPLYGVMHLRVIASGLITKLAREQVRGLTRTDSRRGVHCGFKNHCRQSIVAGSRWCQCTQQLLTYSLLT
jgi:hypothetical protein